MFECYTLSSIEHIASKAEIKLKPTKTKQLVVLYHSQFNLIEQNALLICMGFRQIKPTTLTTAFEAVAHLVTLI